MSEEPPAHSYPKDAQTQRTRWELRIILIIVAVVIVGSLLWRAIGHHPAKPELTHIPADRPNAFGRLPGPALPAPPPASSHVAP